MFMDPHTEDRHELDRPLLYLGDDGDLRLHPPAGRTYPELKEIGATWDNLASTWKMPGVRMNVVQCQDAIRDLDMAPGVKRMLEGYGFDVHPVEIPNVFYDYQGRAVQYLTSNPRGSLLNMSPGLGKTAVATVSAQELGLARVLIVAPASLLFTWEREILKWSDGQQEVTIAHGHPPVDSGWVITTYEGVVRHPALYERATWDLLIIDESVLIKTRTTKRFKALEHLRRKVAKVWMLSGSPTTRFADDLWTQVHLAFPKAFRSFWRFAERYCVFEDNIWAKTGKTIVGTRESRDLTYELGDIMLTVNQEDVLPELPEYLFETIDVPLSSEQRRAYKSMLSDFLIELEGHEITADNKLAQLTRLQQVTSGMANLDDSNTASSKVEAVLDLLASQAYQTPMLVWTHWKGNARYLTTALKAARINAEWVSGDDPTRTRDHHLEAYKAGSLDVLVLSMGVGKFGHTLTDTRTVVYLDKTWNADDFFQSLRRVRRIGLKHRPVVVTLRSPKTTDDLLELNLAGKMPSIAKVTNSALKELLKGLGL